MVQKRASLEAVLPRLAIVGLGGLAAGPNLTQLISERHLHAADTDKTLAVVPLTIAICAVGVAAMWLFRSRALPIYIACCILECAVPTAVMYSRHVVTDRVLETMAIGFFIIFMGMNPQLGRTDAGKRSGE